MLNVMPNNLQPTAKQSEIPGVADTRPPVHLDKGFFTHRKNQAYRKKTAPPMRAKPAQGGNGYFSPTTEKWMASVDEAGKQSLGQFMSPRPLRSHLLDQLCIKSGDKVLDPSVGTGEFLGDVKQRCPGAEVYGWDVDDNILRYAKRLVPAARLRHVSALTMPETGRYDFVIGNPPYFQLKLNRSERFAFREVISGRPNIFALFFKIGVEALKPGGELAYIVPPSMNAGAYFKNLREYITRENHVKHLKVFYETDFFHGAQTAIQVIVVKKGRGAARYSHTITDASSGNRLTLLTENAAREKKKFRHHVSLHGLGYAAATGSVVWNENRDKLTNKKRAACVPLLYARNIVNNKIVLSVDERRPQYIKTKNALSGKAIVVNRIVGAVGKGEIKCALVDDGFAFAAENHLNVIKPIRGAKQKISIERLFDIINNKVFVDAAMSITGNTQLSASEWNYFVPMAVNSRD